MIIWLNGAFGAGKTQTAYELQRRLPGSFVYDPENAGYFIRKNLPLSLGLDDFQDYPMWREFNYTMLDYIAGRHDGAVIVPMTVTDRDYYEQLIGALSQTYPLTHLILWASRQTLLRRLASRLESDRSWAARQIDRCLRAFEGDIPGEKIHTDRLSIGQTAEEAAARAGVTLVPDRRSRLRKWADRVVTQCRHIR